MSLILFGVNWVELWEKGRKGGMERVFVIMHGLIFLVQIYTPEVAVVEELEESVRGAGGFGSTG